MIQQLSSNKSKSHKMFEQILTTKKASRKSMLTIIFTFFFVLNFVFSNGQILAFASSNTKLNSSSMKQEEATAKLNFQSTSLLNVFKVLGNQFNVKFLYREGSEFLNKEFSLSNGSYNLAQVMEKIAKNNSLKYKQIGNIISIVESTTGTVTKPITDEEVIAPEEANAAITGTVTDAANGDPLIGASVTVKGTQNGTVTDADGKFAINAENGDILVISYVGYSSKEITIQDESPITIGLQVASEIMSEVEVVGSRGKPRTDVNRPVPVDVINAKELQQTGQVDLGQMAQFTSPSFNSAKYGINGVANYADPATLRGMSPDQVLVLVNGKRRHQFSALNLNVTVGKGTVVTDLNSIPSLAVERLEILRDGAAAQYGSDAIAGIVNIGLNKSTGKGTFKTQYGVTKEGDGATQMGAINYGFKLGKEKSYMNFTLHYQNAAGTNRSDPYNGRIYAAVGTNAAASLLVEDSIRAVRGQWPTTKSGTPFTVSKYGSNPTKAFQGFVNIGYPLSNNWNLYAFGGSSKKDIAAEGFFRNAIPTDANSNIDIYPNGYDPDLPGTNVDFSGVAGINRKLDKGWNLDFSTGYGKNYLDLYARNTTNPSLGAASPTEFYVGRSGFGQSTTEANISKNIEGFAGTKSLNFAMGTQFRIDFFEQQAGDEASYKVGPLATTKGKAPGSSGRPGIAPDDALNVNRSNIGVYVDAESDITDKFLVATALRYENYSDFGSNISGKLASRLKLTEGFALRGSINKGFRAPSLQQINNSVTTSTVQAGAILQTKQLSNSDPRLAKIGIENPKAENSWNYNLGLTAKAGEKLLFTIDAYQIDITDRIIISEAMTVSSIAALKTNFTGLQQISFFTNHLNTSTKGIDFVTTFKHQFNEKSRFNSSLALTANKTSITNVKATPDALQNGTTAKVLIIDTISRSLIETSQPGEKVLLSLGYQYGKFNLTTRANYFGDVLAWEKPAGRPHRNQSFAAKTIYDLVLTFTPVEKLSISIGGNNVTDVYPDKVLNTYASYFSGQTPYTRNANQFGFNGAFYYANVTLNF
jgi:iron complex outermembrane recepter protein